MSGYPEFQNRRDINVSFLTEGNEVQENMIFFSHFETAALAFNM